MYYTNINVKSCMYYTNINVKGACMIQISMLKVHVFHMYLVCSPLHWSITVYGTWHTQCRVHYQYLPLTNEWTMYGFCVPLALSVIKNFGVESSWCNKQFRVQLPRSQHLSAQHQQQQDGDQGNFTTELGWKRQLGHWYSPVTRKYSQEHVPQQELEALLHCTVLHPTPVPHIIDIVINDHTVEMPRLLSDDAKIGEKIFTLHGPTLSASE